MLSFAMSIMSVAFFIVCTKSVWLNNRPRLQRWSNSKFVQEHLALLAQKKVHDSATVTCYKIWLIGSSYYKFTRFKIYHYYLRNWNHAIKISHILQIYHYLPIHCIFHIFRTKLSILHPSPSSFPLSPLF